jgi:DNA invertase Pin-like site-specific DNA recombinase
VRAAIYARVSTSNTGQDPAMQTRELRELCQHRGWEIAGEGNMWIAAYQGLRTRGPNLTG